MASKTVNIDGSKGLSQQEADLNFAEQIRFSKVTTYQKGPTGTANLATLELVPLGQPQPPPLQLVAVTAGQDLAALAKAQTAAGKKVVFQATVFVGGVLTGIVGLR